MPSLPLLPFSSSQLPSNADRKDQPLLPLLLLPFSVLTTPHQRPSTQVYDAREQRWIPKAEAKSCRDSVFQVVGENINDILYIWVFLLVVLDAGVTFMSMLLYFMVSMVNKKFGLVGEQRRALNLPPAPLLRVSGLTDALVRAHRVRVSPNQTYPRYLELYPAGSSLSDS